jgi:hypothetical protein
MTEQRVDGNADATVSYTQESVEPVATMVTMVTSPYHADADPSHTAILVAIPSRGEIMAAEAFCLHHKTSENGWENTRTGEDAEYIQRLPRATPT